MSEPKLLDVLLLPLREHLRPLSLWWLLQADTWSRKTSLVHEQLGVSHREVVSARNLQVRVRGEHESHVCTGKTLKILIVPFGFPRQLTMAY